MTMLVLLGTGAGPGVPAHYCGCPACEEAAADPTLSRTRCSLLIRQAETTLVDAGPDLRTQLLRERVEEIDQLVLTHAHYDHCGGLGELEFYVHMKRRKPLPAYMTAKTLEALRRSRTVPLDCLEVRRLVPWQTVELDGVHYTPLEVTHAPGTVGLLLETAGGRRTAYVPDTGPLPRATQQLIHEVDTLILGATFWGENRMPDDHLSVDEAIAVGRDVAAGEVYLTHVAMHYDTPITARELESYLCSQGNHLHVARDRQMLAV